MRDPLDLPEDERTRALDAAPPSDDVQLPLSTLSERPARIAEANLLGQLGPGHAYGQLLADTRRLSAFREAIERLVPAGAHVVELGGGTGVLSYFASRRARKVTCIEPDAERAALARRLLQDNGADEQVQVLQADPRDYVPDEPVDVVLCDLLHPALLREPQVDVLTTFKLRHEERFGQPVTRILPEATVLAVQPIFQPYDFLGYHAPVPMYFGLDAASPGTVELGPKGVYALAEYLTAMPTTFAPQVLFTCERDGTLNALRFLTKNVVGIFVDESRSADWDMLSLSLPLPEPLLVRERDRVRLQLSYEAGGSISSLVHSLRAEILQTS